MRTGKTVPYFEISPNGRDFIVGVCGCVITFTNYGNRVRKIETGIIPLS